MYTFKYSAPVNADTLLFYWTTQSAVCDLSATNTTLPISYPGTKTWLATIFCFVATRTW